MYKKKTASYTYNCNCEIIFYSISNKYCFLLIIATEICCGSLCGTRCVSDALMRKYQPVWRWCERFGYKLQFYVWRHCSRHNGCDSITNAGSVSSWAELVCHDKCLIVMDTFKRFLYGVNRTIPLHRFQFIQTEAAKQSSTEQFLKTVFSPNVSKLYYRCTSTQSRITCFSCTQCNHVAIKIRTQKIKSTNRTVNDPHKSHCFIVNFNEFVIA